MEEDFDINLNKCFFSDSKNNKNLNMNIEKIDIEKADKIPKTREPSTSDVNKIKLFNPDEENENKFNTDNKIINKKINVNFSNNDKNEKIKKNIKIKIEGSENLNLKGNFPINISSNGDPNSKINNNNILMNNVNFKNANLYSHNINNYNINNFNRILSNKVFNSNRNINLIPNNLNTKINNIYSFKMDSGISEKIKKQNIFQLNKRINEKNDFKSDSLLKDQSFQNENSISLKNSTFLEEFNVNFTFLDFLSLFFENINILYYSLKYKIKLKNISMRFLIQE